MAAGKDVNPLVFPLTTGTVLDGHNVAKRFRALVRRAGFENFSIYDTRHTYASHALLMGAPVNYVAKRLGHPKPWIDVAGVRALDSLD